jgi:hypothetical protein
MADIFNINSEATKLDIEDAINERLAKAKAITIKLLNTHADEIADNELSYNVVWTVSDLLEEIESLMQHLQNLSQEHKCPS